MSQDIRRQRFTSDDDLCLLKEVLASNPLANPEYWVNVQQNMISITGKTYSVRTLKDHLMLLLKLWTQKNQIDQKRPIKEYVGFCAFRSGVEEIFTEKDILLQDISDLCKEIPSTSNVSKKRKLSKEKQIIEFGKESREKCAKTYLEVPAAQEILAKQEGSANETWKSEHSYCVEAQVEVISTVYDTETPETTNLHLESSPSTSKGVPRSTQESQKKVLTPNRTRHNKSVLLRKNALEYLNKQKEREQEIKLKEIKCEERKLELEERKINIEERKLLLQEKQQQIDIEQKKKIFELELEKIKLDINQRKDTQALIQSQQNIINSLLKKLG